MQRFTITGMGEYCGGKTTISKPNKTGQLSGIKEKKETEKSQPVWGKGGRPISKKTLKKDEGGQQKERLKRKTNPSYKRKTAAWTIE